MITDGPVRFEWKSSGLESHLSSSGYKTLPDFFMPYRPLTLFAIIAQSITYSKSPESSSILVFVSGVWFSADHTIQTLHVYERLHIVDDIIKPFLPQSAPHLQHIPKLFIITACTLEDPHAQPPNFPDDPDGNYCVAYHVASSFNCMHHWAEYITDYLFRPNTSVQETIENYKPTRERTVEHLHYFSSLKSKLVLTNK